MDNKCKDCKWWSIINRQCRRYAPVLDTTGYVLERYGQPTGWPETSDTDWCGDFVGDFKKAVKHNPKGIYLTDEIQKEMGTAWQKICCAISETVPDKEKIQEMLADYKELLKGVE